MNETEAMKKQKMESDFNFSIFAHDYCWKDKKHVQNEPKTYVDQGTMKIIYL